MKQVVLIGGGKKSLILDIIKKNQTTKEDFEFQKEERKENLKTKAKTIIEKNENAFVE